MYDAIERTEQQWKDISIIGYTTVESLHLENISGIDTIQIECTINMKINDVHICV